MHIIFGVFKSGSTEKIAFLDAYNIDQVREIMKQQFIQMPGAWESIYAIEIKDDGTVGITEKLVTAVVNEKTKRVIEQYEGKFAELGVIDTGEVIFNGELVRVKEPAVFDEKVVDPIFGFDPETKKPIFVDPKSIDVDPKIDPITIDPIAADPVVVIDTKSEAPVETPVVEKSLLKAKITLPTIQETAPKIVLPTIQGITTEIKTKTLQVNPGSNIVIHDNHMKTWALSSSGAAVLTSAAIIKGTLWSSVLPVSIVSWLLVICAWTLAVWAVKRKKNG